MQNPFKNDHRQVPDAHRPDSASSKAGKVGIKKTLARSNGEAIELQQQDLGLGVQKKSTLLKKNQTQGVVIIQPAGQ